MSNNIAHVFITSCDQNKEPLLTFVMTGLDILHHRGLFCNTSTLKLVYLELSTRLEQLFWSNYI